MTDPIGPLTREYLRRVGYTPRKISSWCGQTRLLQDIGLSGDNAWDEFKVMHRDFSVDLTGFHFDYYFPSEFSHEPLVLTFLPRTGWANGIKRKYPEITLGMIEEILARKR